ncbi:MAG: class SAM-dependent methyltransferase [Conexibacter sp.]|nr:class SAM-dependent methyltransferase [Conexibacter sp.]
MPEPLLERARTSLRLRALDLRDRVGRRSDRLVPPRRLDFVGHSDFVDTGDEFLAHFVALGALAPDERVLDIGCGIGRMARPLAGYLGERGSYDGFDINAEGIGWCRRRYRAHRNFTFAVVDLYNRRYNPAGTQPADAFAFPYADAQFDFALATSVFTHLLETAADRYVAEAARVLAPGGRLFATWFLLDEGSRAAIAAGRAGLPFLDADQPVAVVSDDVPEEAIAFDRTWLTDALTRHGLRLTAVHEGSWRGDEAGTSFQDIVVATREHA